MCPFVAGTADFVGATASPKKTAVRQTCQRVNERRVGGPCLGCLARALHEPGATCPRARRLLAHRPSVSSPGVRLGSVGFSRTPDIVQQHQPPKAATPTRASWGSGTPLAAFWRALDYKKGPLACAYALRLSPSAMHADHHHAPTRIPASTSLGQWTPRYTRLDPIAASHRTPPATAHHRARG